MLYIPINSVRFCPMKGKFLDVAKWAGQVGSIGFVGQLGNRLSQVELTRIF